jgi:hypothetical protein
MTSVIAKYNFINNCHVGILCESPGGSVYGNLLTNIYVNGIDHQSSTSANPITVNNNSIYHTPLWASGHGISCQIAGHGAIIKNNVIYTNVTAGATGQCLTVSNSNNVQFNNNALFATGAGTAQIASLAYTGQDAGLLKNYTTADWARYLTDLDSMKSNATVVWTNNGTLGNAAMLAGVMANPKYTNGSGAYSLAADFKLLPGSPCINTGLVGALPATDYEGKVWISPDIGAYAFRNTGFFSF